MSVSQHVTTVDERRLRTARAQRADLRHTILALEDALARPVPHRCVEWAADLHDALVEIAATFERHIAVTEGDTGFLSDIAEHSPRLINAVRRLEHEHARIRSDLARALATVRQIDTSVDDAAIARVRGTVTVLLADLLRHRQHGADLVYEAHAVDIGGSD